VKVGSNAHVWTMLFVFGFCVSIALNALSDMLGLEGAMRYQPHRSRNEWLVLARYLSLDL
jgi:hypothetical protein